MTTSISSILVACLKGLNALTSNPELKAWASEVPSDSWADELGRLRVWAANIGAHQTGQSSLDYRLRDASHIRAQTVKLLERLQRTLDDAEAFLAGPDEDDDDFPADEDEETELQQVYSSLVDTVDCLFQLSMIIRRPVQHDRLLGTKKLDADVFEPYDRQHVENKHPKAGSIVVERLGAAISRRRAAFKYRERHHAKLAKGIERATAEPTDRSSAGDHNERRDAVSTLLSQTIATDYEEPHIDYDETASNSGASQTSYAPSLWESSDKITVPKLPKDCSYGKAFECPYCFFIVTVSNRRSWARHVFRDLMPYICVFPECSAPNRLFDSRHDWFQHLRTKHIPSVKASEISTCPLRCGADVPVVLLERHLGRHLEELALFALPRREVGDEQMSNESQPSLAPAEDLDDAHSTSSEDLPDATRQLAQNHSFDTAGDEEFDDSYSSNIITFIAQVAKVRASYRAGQAYSDVLARTQIALSALLKILRTLLIYIKSNKANTASWEADDVDVNKALQQHVRLLDGIMNRSGYSGTPAQDEAIENIVSTLEGDTKILENRFNFTTASRGRIFPQARSEESDVEGRSTDDLAEISTKATNLDIQRTAWISEVDSIIQDLLDQPRRQPQKSFEHTKKLIKDGERLGLEGRQLTFLREQVASFGDWQKRADAWLMHDKRTPEFLEPLVQEGRAFGVAAASTNTMRALEDVGADQDRQVFVSNLGYDNKWPSLRKFMKQAGEVLFTDIFLLPDGMSTGCGKVTYKTREQAKHAIQTLNGQRLEGHHIHIREYSKSDGLTGGTSYRGLEPQDRGSGRSSPTGNADEVAGEAKLVRSESPEPGELGTDDERPLSPDVFEEMIADAVKHETEDKADTVLGPPVPSKRTRPMFVNKGPEGTSLMYGEPAETSIGSHAQRGRRHRSSADLQQDSRIEYNLHLAEAMKEQPRPVDVELSNDEGNTSISHNQMGSQNNSPNAPRGSNSLEQVGRLWATFHKKWLPRCEQFISDPPSSTQDSAREFRELRDGVVNEIHLKAYAIDQDTTETRNARARLLKKVNQTMEKVEATARDLRLSMLPSTSGDQQVDEKDFERQQSESLETRNSQQPDSCVDLWPKIEVFSVPTRDSTRRRHEYFPTAQTAHEEDTRMTEAKNSELAGISAEKDVPQMNHGQSMLTPEYQEFMARQRMAERMAKIQSMSKRQPSSDENESKSLEQKAAARSTLGVDMGGSEDEDTTPEIGNGNSIRFTDARKLNFSIPYEKCNRWKDMEDFINQSFKHHKDLAEHVAAGHYDLIGPDDEIIQPQDWEDAIEPDMQITMNLWSIVKPTTDLTGAGVRIVADLTAKLPYRRKVTSVASDSENEHSETEYASEPRADSSYHSRRSSRGEGQFGERDLEDHRDRREENGARVRPEYEEITEQLVEREYHNDREIPLRKESTAPRPRRGKDTQSLHKESYQGSPEDHLDRQISRARERARAMREEELEQIRRQGDREERDYDDDRYTAPSHVSSNESSGVDLERADSFSADRVTQAPETTSATAESADWEPEQPARVEDGEFPSTEKGDNTDVSPDEVQREEIIAGKPYPRRGKTRMPKRLVHTKVLFDLGYPYYEENERTILIDLALGPDDIDEVLDMSNKYRRSEMLNYDSDQAQSQGTRESGQPLPSRKSAKEGFASHRARNPNAMGKEKTIESDSDDRVVTCTPSPPDQGDIVVPGRTGRRKSVSYSGRHASISSDDGELGSKPKTRGRFEVAEISRWMDSARSEDASSLHSATSSQDHVAAIGIREPHLSRDRPEAQQMREELQRLKDDEGSDLKPSSVLKSMRGDPVEEQKIIGQEIGRPSEDTEEDHSNTAGKAVAHEGGRKDLGASAGWGGGGGGRRSGRPERPQPPAPPKPGGAWD